MKRSLSVLLSFIFCFACFLTVVNAGNTKTADTVVTTNRIELEDGGYIIEEITETVASQARATSTKTGSKTATRYDANNDAIFAVKVTGTFTYTGTSSSATSSTATVYIYHSAATYVSKSASYSGNTATATGKVKYGGVTYPLTVSLSCSATGVLS